MDGERAPVEQKIVEVEQLAGALPLPVGAEDAADLVEVGEAPGEVLGQHLRERRLHVDGAGVDVGERALAREAAAGLGQAQLLADDVEQVGAVGSVDHAQPRRQPERLRVEADQTPGDRVERPGDHRAARGGIRPLEQRACAGDHRGGGAAGEGEQENPLRPDPFRDQPGDPGRQRRRLATTGAGQDQQRTVGGRGRRTTLLRIQLCQPTVPRRRPIEHLFEYTDLRTSVRDVRERAPLGLALARQSAEMRPSWLRVVGRRHREGDWASVPRCLEDLRDFSPMIADGRRVATPACEAGRTADRGLAGGCSTATSRTSPRRGYPPEAAIAELGLLRVG